MSEDAALRPQNLDEYEGQERLKNQLVVMICGARSRGEALDHILLAGPPGLGKTSLAQILATEMGARMHTVSGPALQKKGDLAGLLTALKENDILFIDEIHRLPMTVEENLYTAMEDFRFDIILGSNQSAKTVSLPLPRFTLVGATTKAGMLSSPLRDRFGFIGRMELYTVPELAGIVRRSANRLRVEINSDGALEVAARSRGTPRLANRYLRRVRDYADAARVDLVTGEIAARALDALEIDSKGLGPTDRRILEVLVNQFGGGPVGLAALAASVGEDAETLAEAHEPYLLQEGFLTRSPRGRVATPLAFVHVRRQQVT